MAKVARLTVRLVKGGYKVSLHKRATRGRRALFGELRFANRESLGGPGLTKFIEEAYSTPAIRQRT